MLTAFQVIFHEKQLMILLSSPKGYLKFRYVDQSEWVNSTYIYYSSTLLLIGSNTAKIF